MLLGGACSAASYALALSTKSEDALAPILNSIALPVMLLSGIMLPISTATGAPQWLVTLSDVIPTKYIVNGLRTAFTGEIFTGPTMWAIFWAVVFVIAGLWVGTRTFGRDA
jgi:ABC-2 type transport system permease protein